MSLYEGMFVMDNRQANRDWDGSLEKLKSMLTKHGAEIVRCEKWGERKLAYEMDGRRRGTYVLAYFNATGTVVNQVYHECNLTDLMLRALILKVEKMPPEELMRSPEELPERRTAVSGPPRFDRGDRYDRGDRDRGDRGDRARETTARAASAPAEAPAAADEKEKE